MDTITVLTIIKMIDIEINDWKQSVPDPEKLIIAEHALSLLQDKLQEYIETKINH